jgi:hypothetical protein
MSNGKMIMKCGRKKSLPLVMHLHGGNKENYTQKKIKISVYRLKIKTGTYRI